MARILYPRLFAPVATTPESVTVDRWAQPPSLPRRYPGGLSPAALASGAVYGGPAPASSETILEDKWHQPPAQPVLAKPRFGAMLAGITLPVSGAPEQVTADRWAQPPAQPRRFPAALPGAIVASGAVYGGPAPASAEVITEDKWHQPPAQPVLPKTRLPAMLSGITLPVSGAAEIVTADRWAQPPAQPVLPKPRMPAMVPAFGAMPALPFTAAADGWAQPATQPVLAKPRMGAMLAGISQTLIPIFVEPVTMDKWYQDRPPNPGRRVPNYATQQFSTALGLVVIGGTHPGTQRATVQWMD